MSALLFTLCAAFQLFWMWAALSMTREEIRAGKVDYLSVNIVAIFMTGLSAALLLSQVQM